MRKPTSGKTHTNTNAHAEAARPGSGVPGSGVSRLRARFHAAAQGAGGDKAGAKASRVEGSPAFQELRARIGKKNPGAGPANPSDPADSL